MALQHRDFRLLWLASLVSAFGGMLQGTVNLWQIYDLTGSALLLGLTGLTRAVPILCFSLIGGVIADRVDRRKIIMFSQGTNGVLAILLGFLTAAALIQVWHIYAVMFVNATLMSVSAPGRRAIVANLVPRQHLMNAYALEASTHQLSRIVGPAVGGALAAAFGLPLAYMLNGLAHVATFIALGRIYLGPVPERPRGSPVQNLVEGLAFVRLHSIIVALLATDAAAMLFGSYSVLLPIFADRLGVGIQGFGVLQAAPGVGGLLGATVVMSLGDFRYKGYFIVAAILAYCVFLVALALSPWFLLSLLIVGLLGFTDSLQATPRNAVIQLVTPDELRGRVSSFQHMLVVGMPHLGQGIAGGAAAAMGPVVALIIGAAACAAVNTGLLLGRRDLRDPDLGSISAPRPTPVQVPAGS